MSSCVCSLSVRHCFRQRVLMGQRRPFFPSWPPARSFSGVLCCESYLDTKYNAVSMRTCPSTRQGGLWQAADSLGMLRQTLDKSDFTNSGRRRRHGSFARLVTGRADVHVVLLGEGGRGGVGFRVPKRKMLVFAHYAGMC